MNHANWMNRSTWLMVIAVISGLTLSACSSTGETTKHRPPSYASPVGTDYWEVSCGREDYILDQDSLYQFYKEDGTQKSLMEFCNEQRGGSAIRNR